MRRNRYHFVYLLLPSLKRIDCLKQVFLNFIQFRDKIRFRWIAGRDLFLYDLSFL